MPDTVDRVYRAVLTRLQRQPLARRLVQGAVVLARETARDKVGVRAATLSYWSLVTIVPVLVLIAAVLSPLTPEGGAPVHEVLLRNLLAEPVRGVGDQVEAWLAAIDTGRLGVIGIVGVLYTSSRIYFSVEAAYNDMWNTRPRRSWVRRMVLFYTTITLGPLLITAGFQLSDSFGEQVGVTGGHLDHVASVAVTALAFTTFIRALPDTNVRWGPAVIGGLGSAVAFEIAKEAFGLYTRLFGTEDKAALIYGAVWLFPVFLLWLYLLWVIVLMGVEVAYVVQRRDDLLAGEDRRLAGVDFQRRQPDALFALQCMVVVCTRFRDGRGPTPEPDVTHVMAADPLHVAAALENLEAAGVVAETPLGYVPLLPPDRLTIREVVQRYRAITRPDTAPDAPGSGIVEELLGSASSRLDAPLAELTGPVLPAGSSG